MKPIILAAVLSAAFSTFAMAEDMLTKTPQLALPEPEGVSAALPQSTVTEAQPLALPEPETEAIAPYKRCSDRETVYLTN